MAFTQITVTGNYQNPDGSAASGMVTFTPTAVMRNSDGLTETSVSQTVRATLNISGAISVQLAATDDPGTTPVGVTYLVREYISGQRQPASYYIAVPADTVGTIDLDTVDRLEQPTVGYPARFEPLGAVADHVAHPDPHTGYVRKNTLQAKGDLLAADGASSPARHPAGSPGQALVANPNNPTGLGWVTLTSAEGGDVAAHELAADPHPQYLTDDRLSATLKVIDVVRDHGADPTGVTDSSAAFQAAHAAARAAIAVDLTGTSANRRGRVKILLPAGRYLITQGDALMAATSGNRTHGIVYEGAGRSVTEIVFQPASGGAQLMRNNDVWLTVVMRGIRFISQTDGSRFLYSTSSGGAQDYLFEACEWTGLWAWGIGLDGTNNNSEWEFRRCQIGGRFSTAFLWSGMSTNSEQDQFLNFDFYSCSAFLLSGGTWLRFDYGGAIRVWGGNLIADQGGKFFDLRNNVHAYGVQQLSVVGARVELRNDTSRVIDCAWGRGSVSFLNCDEEADVFYVPATAIGASYRPGALGGPSVRYQGCTLHGRHEYGYGTNSFAESRSVVYDQCWIADEPASFILFTETSGGSDNRGGRPGIEFTECRARASGKATYALDQTLGWYHSTSSQPKYRAAVFRNGQGGLPITTALDVWLPLNAVVIAVRFYKAAAVGTSVATNWSYTVRSSETTPTTLASVSGGGTTQWVNGFNAVQAVTNYVANSDARRHLQLVPANVDQTAAGIDGFVTVEYLG